MWLIAGKLLGVAWPYLLGAAAIFGVWESGHHSGYKGEHAKTLAAEAKYEEYHAKQAGYLTNVTNAWDDERKRADESERKRENDARIRFQGVSANDRRDAVARGIVVPAGALRVFDAAASAASAAGAPVEHLDASEGATVADLRGLIDDNAEAYADAFGKWHACVEYYNAGRAKMIQILEALKPQ